MRAPWSPQPEPDGTFKPSSLALRLATSSTTDFDGGHYADPYEGGDRTVLVVCTEQKAMTMANGKQFSTGNHPVETLVPLLHLKAAGFDIEIATPTGAPAHLEHWAMPTDDAAVMGLYRELEGQFARPKSLKDVVAADFEAGAPYCAVFLPGGHGAMLGLPEDADLGRVLHAAHDAGLHTLAICHGPAALLSTQLPEANEASEGFLYAGYEMAAFPDAVDRLTPLMGYMPGRMPWYFNERLEELGVDVINRRITGKVHVDRRLITGDSPDAANEFGRVAAEALLASVR